MKEGWVKKKLGEVCTLHKEQGIYSNLPYIGMEHIESSSGILLSWINASDVKSTTFRFDKGDVLYGRLRPYLKKVIIAPFEGCCSTEIFPIKSKDVLADFLKYWFLLDSTTDKINDTCSGCRMPRANMNQVINFDFKYPSKPEQQHIVEKLDSGFAKIEQIKANAEKNLQQAKDLFQATLKEELKGNKGSKTRLLKEIAVITSSTRIFKNEYVSDGIPFYRTKEIKELANGENISLELFISQKRYQEIKAKSGVPRIGDILVSAVGTIGEILVINNNNEFYFKDGNIIWLKDIKHIIPALLKYNLRANIDKLKFLSKGTAYNALTIEKFKTMEISFPISLAEQQQIVDKLDKLSDICKKLEDNYNRILTECDALKQALLRKAFNGEL